MRISKRARNNFSILSAFIITVLILIGASYPKQKAELQNQQQPQILVSKKVIMSPVFNKKAPPLVLSAQSVYTVDMNSNIVLYEKNPDLPSLPASTAKILTALVSLDYYPLDYVIQVKSNGVEGQKMGLAVGEQITVDSLLKGLLIYSANDAAEVLADNYPGGRNLFVSKMNLKAKEAGLNDSLFTNPVGLDGGGQFTTAKDLVKIATFAMNYPYIADTVSTQRLTVTSTDGKYIHKLQNINQLLGKVNGVLGVKTGWTENAHENLITYVDRNNRKIMIALLGSEDRFGETEKLIDWIYNNYTWEIKEVDQ